MSRVTSRDGLVILNADEDIEKLFLIKNIVYQEVFANINEN